MKRKQQVCFTIGSLRELLAKKHLKKDTKILIGCEEVHDYELHVDMYQFTTEVFDLDTRGDLNAIVLRPTLPLTVDYKVIAAELVRDLPKSRKPRKPAKRG